MTSPLLPRCVTLLVVVLVTNLQMRCVSQTINLSAMLTEEQETVDTVDVPPNAVGFLAVVLDREQEKFSWSLTVENLSSPITDLHFHAPADFGETAEIVVDPILDTGLMGEVELRDPQEAPGSGNELLDQLLAHLWYVNVHTERNPNGEIRGQIVPEPSSTTIALVLLLTCLSWCRGRRGG